MTAQDLIVVADQHRVRESETLYARSDLPKLLPRMCPRVSRVGLQGGNRQVLNSGRRHRTKVPVQPRLCRAPGWVSTEAFQGLNVPVQQHFGRH